MKSQDKWVVRILDVWKQTPISINTMTLICLTNKGLHKKAQAGN